MKTNYHTHTTRCMHATGSDEDYVLSAIKGGYQELGFSDHTPWKYHTDYVADMRMLPEELPGYVESLHSLREKYRDQISIKIGLECEYFPAYIHWLKEKIKEYQLDYILFGNHHYHTDEKFPYFGHHTENLDMLELYEESAIEGMESGLFCCLAHPDLFMRSYPQFDRHCKLISRHICRTAARLHIPLEYNIGYVAYNEAHGIVPKTVMKSVRDVLQIGHAADESDKKRAVKRVKELSEDELHLLICSTEEKMLQAAANLDFELAAKLRDKLFELQGKKPEELPEETVALPQRKRRRQRKPGKYLKA